MNDFVFLLQRIVFFFKFSFHFILHCVFFFHLHSLLFPTIHLTSSQFPLKIIILNYFTRMNYNNTKKHILFFSHGFVLNIIFSFHSVLFAFTNNFKHNLEFTNVIFFFRKFLYTFSPFGFLFFV